MSNTSLLYKPTQCVTFLVYTIGITISTISSISLRLAFGDGGVGAGLTGWRELTVPDLLLLLSNVRDLISEVYDKLSRPRPRCEIETVVL